MEKFEMQPWKFDICELFTYLEVLNDTITEAMELSFSIDVDKIENLNELMEEIDGI